MKRILRIIPILTILSFSSSQKSYSIDPTLPIILGATAVGGNIIGKSLEKYSPYAPLIATAATPIISGYTLSAIQNSNQRDKIEYFIAGRNYERWIRSQKTWYESTLDPWTGRPPAFSGLTEMDSGIITENKTQNAQSTNSQNQNFSIQVKIPASKDRFSIPRTERIVSFPKLP